VCPPPGLRLRDLTLLPHCCGAVRQHGHQAHTLQCMADADGTAAAEDVVAEVGESPSSTGAAPSSGTPPPPARAGSASPRSGSLDVPASAASSSHASPVLAGAGAGAGAGDVQSSPGLRALMRLAMDTDAVSPLPLGDAATTPGAAGDRTSLRSDDGEEEKPKRFLQHRSSFAIRGGAHSPSSSPSARNMPNRAAAHGPSSLGSAYFPPDTAAAQPPTLPSPGSSPVVGSQSASASGSPAGSPASASTAGTAGAGAGPASGSSTSGAAPAGTSGVVVPPPPPPKKRGFLRAISRVWIRLTTRVRGNRSRAASGSIPADSTVVTTTNSLAASKVKFGAVSVADGAYACACACACAEVCAHMQGAGLGAGGWGGSARAALPVC
jgi:hypothetical protein